MKTALSHGGVWSMLLGVLIALSHGRTLSECISPRADAGISKRDEGTSLMERARANHNGDGFSVSLIAMERGMVTRARLRCVFQRLDGEATGEGLWLTSTAPGKPGDRFRVRAMAVGRVRTENPGARELENLDEAGPLPITGELSVLGETVRFIRSGLVEEYSVSMDGVRQDFLIEQKPPGEGQLRVELAVTGAKVSSTISQSTGSDAQVVLVPLGDTRRKITYSRLRVRDATGRELEARMEVAHRSKIRGLNSEPGLAVVLEDAQAVYPVRIDPTFSDANWVSMGGVSGADYRVYAAVVDGSGNLYIGGQFRVAGDAVATGIAKWDGSNWCALGAGINGSVLALAISGSNLYAGGYFTTAGGVAANYVAKWDGTKWSALGSGMNGNVSALAVSGDDLYVGGSFTRAGDVGAKNIAKWKGSSWTALGSGMNSNVTALAVSGDDLYAGGSFTTAGDVGVNYVAKWNGSSWSALGTGLGAVFGGNPSPVRALAVSGSDLYVGGYFTTAGGVWSRGIAKWNGNSWSALGAETGWVGTDGWVQALAVSGSDLYAGGSFTTAGGVSARNIAKWDGTSWNALESRTVGVDSSVNALGMAGSNLYLLTFA